MSANDRNHRVKNPIAHGIGIGLTRAKFHLFGNANLLVLNIDRCAAILLRVGVRGDRLIGTRWFRVASKHKRAAEMNK
jgi:hypothetical protein